MLSSHGIYDPDKRLVAGEETVASGQKITFQPSLAHMLAEHTVHDASVSGQAVIIVNQFSVPVAVLSLEYFVQTI